MAELWPNVWWAKAMREAEAEAKALMSLHGHKPSSWFRHGDEKQAAEEAEYAWWVNVFGMSEQELDEMMAAIARQYKRTLPLFFRKRHRLMAKWVRLSGMKTKAHGLTTEWR